MSVDREVIIEVEGVSFAYGGNLVLDGVGITVRKGDYLGVIGPNGGGKSTLVKLMLGLIKPDRGTVKMYGKDVGEFRDWWKVGYVAQKVTNFDARFPISVGEVVEMGCLSKRGMLGRLKREDTKAIDWALEQVGMGEHRRRLVGELSGGQQQKVFIARALAQKPEIIFLDEPTAGVDSKSQEQFYDLLERLNRELKITLVLISHDINVIVNEVTEVACVNQGIVACSPDEFANTDQLLGLLGKRGKFIYHNHH